MTNPSIASLLQEERRFPVPEAFKQQAALTDPAIYQEAAKDLEGFWARHAETFAWMKQWDRVLEWNPPWAKWFVGGKLNVAANCLDRHLAGWRRNKAAIIWEGEPGDWRVLTYADLARQTSK
ncbi:MAG: acetyl-coenzyme A synthetase N-terminal domain-containing protein, partial [Candidatus Xenobia bacterium]